jgi:N-acetylneuraminate epimerase
MKTKRTNHRGTEDTEENQNRVRQNNTDLVFSVFCLFSVSSVPLWLVLLILYFPSSLHAEWSRLPSLPDKEGFAGCFAGVSNGVLLCAGGANFPDKKPWDGGTKVWYDTVYALDRPAGQWKVAGKLPRPLGYGVFATYQNRLICVGGSDAERHHADTFALEWKDGKLATTKLPSLPKPIANASGALVGNVLYVIGGQEKPTSEALKSAYQIDLSSKEPSWKELVPLPHGRILSVVANCAGKVFVVGGANVVVDNDGKTSRQYLQDAYQYEGERWKRLADLPHPVTAAPSPTPGDEKGFSIFGGDDGSQVGVVPDKHQGFSKKRLRYDLATQKWSVAGEVGASRVTAPCVYWEKSWVILSGEMKSGIRSPEVWRFQIKE